MMLGKATRNTMALLGACFCFVVAEGYMTRRVNTEMTVRNLSGLSTRRLLEATEPVNMGASTTIEAGQEKDLLRNNAGDHDIQLVTLYLYALQQGFKVTAAPGFGSSIPANPSRVIFEVEWGVGGATPFVALVSAKQGTALTLAASAVKVRALYNEDPLNSPPPLTVGAMLAYGPHAPAGNFGPPTFDVRFTLAGNTNTTLSVPPFAREFVIMSADSVAGVALTRLEFAGGVPATVVAATEGVAGQKILTAPVPDGSFAVEVTNNEVTQQSFAASWVLGL